MTRRRFDLHRVRRWAPWLLTLALAACSASAVHTQAVAVNATALAANRALPLLVRVYAAERAAAVAAAPDAPTAEAAAAAVAQRWRGVWGDCGARAVPDCDAGAWGALRAAEAIYADALDAAQHDGGAATNYLGGLLTLAAHLHDAWCGLASAVPGGVALPDLPVLDCHSDHHDAGAP